MPLPSVLPPGATTLHLVLIPVCFAVEFVIENNAKEFWSAWTGVSLSLWHTVLLNSLFKSSIPTDIINAAEQGEKVPQRSCEVSPSWRDRAAGGSAVTHESRCSSPCPCRPSVWALPQSLPMPCPIGMPSLTASLAGRRGSTLRAALSQ